jgi:hypothetical protein
LVVFIAGEGPRNVLLLPVQLRNLFLDHFIIYFLASTFDAVVLCCATHLTDELSISGHPIKVLKYWLVAGAL